MDGPKIVRSADEVQRAHDMLHQVLLGDLSRVKIDPGRQEAAARGNLDVLCWLLGHQDNNTFLENMAALQLAIAEAGYKVLESPVPMTREQWQRRN